MGRRAGSDEGDREILLMFPFRGQHPQERRKLPTKAMAPAISSIQFPVRHDTMTTLKCNLGMEEQHWKTMWNWTSTTNQTKYNAPAPLFTCFHHIPPNPKGYY